MQDREHHRPSGLVVFGLGLSVAVIGLLVGELIAPQMDPVGLRAFLADAGWSLRLAFVFFVAAFPLGATAMVVGGFLSAGERRGLGAVLLPPMLMAATLALAPPVFGTARTPLFFGVGGCLILALFALVTWQWASSRRSLGDRRRRAADLRMGGYLVLAAAAWQTCGLGGMPSYCLDPHKMLAFDAQPIAVIVLKQVMVLWVLGWAITACAQVAERRALERGDGG